MGSEYPKYAEWMILMMNVQGLYTLAGIVALIGVAWLLMSRKHAEIYSLLRVLLPSGFIALLVFTLLGGVLGLW